MSTEQEELLRQADALAQDILKLSTNMLHVRLRFLDLALGELRPESVPNYTLGTDGHTFYYGPKHILQRYKASQGGIARDLLHLLMHCILQHMYVGLVEINLWNLACDMAVENSVMELYALSPSQEDGAKQHALAQIAENVKYLTAEHIYRYLLENPMEPAYLETLINLFQTDDHWPWYLPKKLKALEDGTTLWNEASAWTLQGSGQSSSSMSKRWKTLGYRMQVDLETSSKQWGNAAGNLLQNLGRLNREKYDYTDFLKKFAVMGEAMKVNDDEFDQNFYTYGLNLYENMPLIEPLEYKDVKRIKEFVVAIDTSGSVAGRQVQKFIQKTYNILKSTESFFTKINLHIIQCDAEIQEDAKITCEEDLDRYLKNMLLKGFGGTDFRPVFSYVDRLIREKEFRNLKGLIYFTDGYGDFPATKPAYEAAFVFVDQSQKPPEVPVWAIRLLLDSEELDNI